jgi:hypothetical protein
MVSAACVGAGLTARRASAIMARVRNPRVLLAIAVGAVAVVAIVLGVWLTAGSGGDETSAEKAPPRVVRGALTLEEFQRPDDGQRELLVSLPGPQYNRPDLVRGTPVVLLRCFDRTGNVVTRISYDWPLVEEFGFAPHIHRPADARTLRSIRRCSLTAPGIDFAGTVSGRLPAAPSDASSTP